VSAAVDRVRLLHSGRCDVAAEWPAHRKSDGTINGGPRNESWRERSMEQLARRCF